MSGREQQVGLAETHAAVDEERIVGLGRPGFRDGHGGGVREPVARARHERVERVAIRERESRGRTGRSDVRARLGELDGRGFRGALLGRVGHHAHANRRSRRFGGGRLDQRQVVLGQPVPDVVGGDVELQDVTLERGGTHLGEPHREGALGEFASCLLGDADPDALGGLLNRSDGHPYPQNLSTRVETLWGGERTPTTGEGSCGAALKRRGV